MRMLHFMPSESDAQTHPKVQAAILTGGSSSRMGRDKAKLVVQGEPMAQRIARLVAAKGIPITILGQEPLPECAFLQDEGEFAGPLNALSRLTPTADFVFVCSCDIPGFQAEAIDILLGEILEHEAAIPMAGGRLQPLCALYKSSVFDRAKELVGLGETRVMRWLDTLDVRRVEIRYEGWVANANTAEEWERLTSKDFGV